MQNNNCQIDEVDIVACKYADSDIDYGIYQNIARSIYKSGFKRGVEVARKRNQGAWIEYDANIGIPFKCTCGCCGYNSYIGDSNFCPECGSIMDLKFKSNEARRFYEAMAKHKLMLKEQKELKEKLL